MIDAYVWGSVNRISPEAPVPVVNISRRESRLGGAANVALNLQSLGVTPIICAAIGKDAAGDQLKQLFDAHDINSEAVIQSQDRITTVKERVLAGSQHLLRLDAESTKPLQKREESELVKKIAKLVPDCDAIVFEDYDKGTITPELIKQVISLAKQHKKPTIVDPKKNNFFTYKGVDLFKPNLKELQEGLNVNFAKDDLTALTKHITVLGQQLSAKYVLTTLSDKGVYIKGESSAFHIQAHKRSISDVSGAGDTVVSIAAICMALNMNPKFIAELSNLGGGIVCEELGVAPVGKEKLMAEAIKYGLQPSI